MTREYVGYLRQVANSHHGCVLLMGKRMFRNYLITSKITPFMILDAYGTLGFYSRGLETGYHCPPNRLIDTEIWTSKAYDN